jgi:hypothetical protein
MDIYVTQEQAFHFIPNFSLEIAHDRVEQKKTGLVAGSVSSLISRPNPAEIQIIATESRLEPFWVVVATARTVYDRNRSYAITLGGREAQSVTLFGQELTPELKSKESPIVKLDGVEHCLEEKHANRAFEGISGERVDFEKYQSYPKTMIIDLGDFLPEGVLVVPPQVKASAVVRQVLADLIKPVQQAQVILEERVDITAIELNFRPVYAFEYEWSPKAKRVVVEFDALTGEFHAGGKWLTAQSLKGIVTQDLIFDISADAVGMLVPGGGIAVKLVKAVVDSRKPRQL